MEKTKEEKRGQFQRLEGEIAEESKRLAIAIGGAAIYSAGVNLFIVPAGLYSGGIMGFAQDCTNDFGQLSASADSEF